MKLAIIITAVCVALAACETPTSQRYSISADNNQAIKALKASGVGIRAFSAPADFSSHCRLSGFMKVADNMNHTQYIQKAFEDELKVSGAYAQGTPKVTLGGRVNRLEFSSTKGLNGGYWQIDLTLDSSNGKKLDVTEYYEFKSGFVHFEACRNTAEAYSRAVQNLVGKALRSNDFATLLR